MKRLLILAALVAASFSFAQAKQPLRFNNDGQFKIMQFTDLHFVSTRPEEVAKTFARMDFIVEAEKPDFIAITGDVIFGKPAKQMLQQILDRLDSYRIPFCIVYGNHDAEQEMSRAEMSQMIASAKYSLNTLNGNGELADLRLPVMHSKAFGKSEEEPFDIFMFDSNDYASNFGFKDVGGYAWFTNDQIQWLRSECAAATAANGGKHVPSMAFFHIPVPEFYDAWILAQEKKHNGVVGLRGEYGGHPRLNSGMFTAMLETGNIMGISCGHDHDSDYIIPYYGIALVYARFSGDDTVYNHLAHGTRVFVLDEKELSEGNRSFSTWIHEDDGRIQYETKFENGVLK